MSLAYLNLGAITTAASSAWQQIAAVKPAVYGPEISFLDAGRDTFHLVSHDELSVRPEFCRRAEEQAIKLPAIFKDNVIQTIKRPAELVITAALAQGLQKFRLQESREMSKELVRIMGRFGETVGEGFKDLPLRKKLAEIYDFMRSGQESVYDENHIPLRTAFKNLADGKGLIGNCHNMSLVIFFIATNMGLNVNLWTDLYHTFVTVSDGGKDIIPVDFPHGKEIRFENEYEIAENKVVHKKHGRECLKLDNMGIIALFLTLHGLYGVEQDGDDQQMIFEDVIRLGPGYARGHYNLGDVMFMDGKYQDAIECYKRALDGEPSNYFFRLSRIMAEYALSLSEKDATIDRNGMIKELEEMLLDHSQFKAGHYFRYILTGDELSLELSEGIFDPPEPGRPAIYSHRMWAKLAIIEGHLELSAK